MKLELIAAKNENINDWDNLVGSSPHGTLFHTWKWLKIVEKHTDSILYPLMAYRGATLIGIYPIFLKRRSFVKLVFSPPPKAYLLYLGPVIHDYENLKQGKKESIFMQLQEELDTFIFSELGCKYARIRSSPGLFDSRPLRWSGYQVEPLYTYRIDLKKGANQVWEQFDRKLRVDINRAVREGVKVEEGDKEDLEFIYRSLSRRFVEQGFKSSDRSEYLLDLYNEFHPDKMKFFIAKYKEDRVGGMISLCYKDITYLWVGVPKADLKGISPNDLVQWEAIKWACNNGFKYYEEMDAGDDPRLRYFKSKYNPDLAIWFSAIKYSSYIYKILENMIKMV